jgi:hypothetical protein
MSLRALSGEHEAKKLLQSKYQIRTAVFWDLQAFHEFKSSPSRQDLSKNRCKPGLQSETAVFWCGRVSSTEQSRSSFPKLING